MCSCPAHVARVALHALFGWCDSSMVLHPRAAVGAQCGHLTCSTLAVSVWVCRVCVVCGVRSMCKQLQQYCMVCVWGAVPVCWHWSLWWMTQQGTLVDLGMVMSGGYRDLAVQLVLQAVHSCSTAMWLRTVYLKPLCCLCAVRAAPACLSSAAVPKGGVVLGHCS